MKVSQIRDILMNQKQTVTIGIPAYNEEKNIKSEFTDSWPVSISTKSDA